MDSTTDVGALQFQNWPVSGVHSLAFRFEPEDSRTGIYILSFANGERYVGQSLDVVNRFSAHRRRWDDITHIAFRPFVAEDLNFREREILAAIEVRGHRVRNLDLAGRPGGDSLLDVVIEEQAQAEWLISDAAEPTDAPRYVEGARRAASLSHFQQLAKHDDFEHLIDAAANFIAIAIPWPSQTEGRFWTATAMPSTGRSTTWHRLITISAQNAEILVIGEATTKGESVITGFINLDKNSGNKVQAWLRQQDLDVHSQLGVYGTIGDVFRVEFIGLRALSDLLQDGSPIAQPAKELALSLMRKGPSMYARFHNYHLADTIFTALANRK